MQLDELTALGRKVLKVPQVDFK
jgi:hypothetical protein